MSTLRGRCAALALVSVLALLGGASVPAQAVDALHFEDPAGDQLDARDSMDILAVTLEVKPMAPRDTLSLVTTIELAAPPESMAASYDLDATVPDCGYFTASYRPGAIWADQFGQVNQYFMECGSPEGAGTGTATAVDARAAVDGNKILIWASVESFPKEVKEAGVLTDISATSQVAEPLMGIIGTEVVGVPADEAVTDQSWQFA